MSSNINEAEVNELSTASATPTLNDAARANRETGLLLTTKEQLVTAIQDRRLLRIHLRVLACIAGFMNTEKAKAWPGRSGIAALLGLAPKTVSNILLELRNFGYLIAERERVPEASNRSLMVYTWGKVDHETIRREIEAFVTGVREGRIPAKHHSDSPGGLGQSQSAGTSKSQPARTSVSEVPAGGARKSQPAGRSNSYKGTQDNIPYGGAEAPKVGLKEVIWKQGLAWLASVYGGDVDPAQIRSRLGKLIKDHGQGLVLDALGKAEAQGAIDPLDFMTAMLTKAKSSPRPLRRY